METPLIGPGQQHVTQSCDESGFSKALQTARRGWRDRERQAARERRRQMRVREPGNRSGCAG